NSTVIGEYPHPKVRLPGSGGACEIAIHARKVYIIMPLSKRSFVEKLDFVTSPGHLSGKPDERVNLGMPGTGPQLIITNKAIFDFRKGEMTLCSIHPGSTEQEIRDEVSWPLKAAADLQETPLPSENELRIIREELDSEGIYTSK
ncbi:MAG: CoA-transferase subunit beta, partial [Anaerolineales bacterium]|nr:CoA-transferase subunit beta [Anaerolineales bacterium]